MYHRAKEKERKENGNCENIPHEMVVQFFEFEIFKKHTDNILYLNYRDLITVEIKLINII